MFRSKLQSGVQTQMFNSRQSGWPSSKRLQIRNAGERERECVCMMRVYVWSVLSCQLSFLVMFCIVLLFPSHLEILRCLFKMKWWWHYLLMRQNHSLSVSKLVMEFTNPGSRILGIGAFLMKHLEFVLAFYWSTVGLQCCVSFRCTAGWVVCIHYIYIFRVFSVIVYYKILNIVLFAV